MSTQNYNATTGSLLTRGACQPPGTSIGATTTLTTDVLCQGESELVVEVDMTGAANGDLSVIVAPYESDNATIMPITVPVNSATGPTFASGHVYYIGRFDVDAVERCQIQIRNTTAGALVLTRSSWRLSGG